MPTTTLTSPHRLACLAALGSLLMLPLCVAAQGEIGKAASSNSASAPAAASAAAPPAKAATDVTAACERAVRDLLATKGSATVEVKFNGPLSSPRRLPGDEQMVLRGGGSWRGGKGGVHTFDYTCNADPRTSEAVGMVMRDTTPVSAKTEAAGSALEPDLTSLSPAVCESAIAVALKKRWPRVSEISFDSETRTVKQTNRSTAELHGRGRALPAQGSPQSFFGFDCEFDTRDGRLLSSRLSG